MDFNIYNFLHFKSFDLNHLFLYKKLIFSSDTNGRALSTMIYIKVTNINIICLYFNTFNVANSCLRIFVLDLN